MMEMTLPSPDQSRVDISFRRIFEISAPVMLTQLTYTGMGFIDTVMVGRLGVTSLAGIGLGAMTVWWLMSFLFGSIAGVNTAVAQAEGARDRRGVADALIQGTWMGLGIGCLLILVWPFLPLFFAWVNPEPEVAAIGLSYMKVRLLSAVAVVPIIAADAFYRGLGRTVIPMVSAFAQLALNCGLNYGFIFGHFGFPELGAPGTAVGTVLAQFAVGSVLWLSIPLGSLGRKYGVGQHLRPDPRILRMLLRLSVPIGFQNFMEMGGVSVFGVVMARLGEAQMAATQAVIQNWAVAFMAGFGMSVTATTLVGQSVGARDEELARSAVRRVLGIGYLLMIPMAVLYLLYPETLMSIFAQGEDFERLRPFARPLFLIVTVCLALDLRFMVYAGALRGAGDTAFPMWVNVASAWLLFVPTVILVTPRFGMNAAWWCFVLHLVVMSSFLAWRFHGSGWKGHGVAARLDDREKGPAGEAAVAGGLVSREPLG